MRSGVGRSGGLSGGQRRRLAVALAFLGRPRLVVLDEPTAGLDVEGRRAVWRAIEHARGRDASVLLATHDLDEAEAVASRVVALSAGRIAADGTVAEVKARAGRARVAFRAPGRPLPPWLAAEPTENGRVVVQAADPGALVERLVRTGVPLRDLEVRPLDLEEALAALTKGCA
ncbi:MAG: AAA family ATPase [Gaiellaceae bacterium]